MAVVSVNTLPDAVAMKMVAKTGRNALADGVLNEHPEILNQFIAKYPEFVVLFRNCRWGTNGSGNLEFDQIPFIPNTSLDSSFQPGGRRLWHTTLGNALAERLGLTATIVTDQSTHNIRPGNDNIILS